MKKDHPDRLKVNIWNRAGQSIKYIRHNLHIDKEIIMRNRGIGKSKRVEIWCPSRSFTKDLYNRLKGKATKNDGHISIGQTFRERVKRRNMILLNQTSRVNHKKETKSLVVMQWNARSLGKKAEELKREILEGKVMIACIQESSLPKDPRYHPKFDDYRMFNLSRDNGNGGGLVTLVHESLLVESCEMKGSVNIEYIKLKIRVNKGFVFTLVNVYIPNQNVREKELNDIIMDSRNQLIMGDFNSRHNSWNDGAENRNGPVLFKWLQTKQLILINQNKSPTYQSPATGTLSTLDLTIVSPAMWRMLRRWKVGEDLGSDHFPVICEMVIDGQFIENENIVHSRYRLKMADWKIFQEETRRLSLEEANTLTEIEAIIHEAAKGAIPMTKRTKPRKFMNNWWNEEINDLRNKRQKARKKWKVQRTNENRSNYNKCNAKLRKTILEAKRKSWSEFVGSMNSNTPSSTVWKRFRSTEGKTGKKINHIKDGRGGILYEDKDKAEAFKNFYRERAGKRIPYPSLLTPEELHLTENMEHCFSCEDVNDKPFTMKELIGAISKIRSSAPGEDDIHNEMLKHCSSTLLEKFLRIFNDIWMTGNIPQTWKTALIFPLLKQGKESADMSSYRPVSLTSCLGKLLERMVNNRLSWRLESKEQLDDYQFGFRRQRSTNDALLFMTNKIFEGYEKKKSTIAVLLDFEAAFDRIPHSTILLQCMKLGIRGKMLKYLVNFLDSRYIKVSVNGHRSECGRIEMASRKDQ